MEAAGKIHCLPTPPNTFAAEVISGLSVRHKQLPSKYLYDATGSRLFEEICNTDDYYVH